MFNATINEAVDHGDMLYSQLETVLQCEASSDVAICCFGPQKSEFICNLIDRTVIDINQLGCPRFADISFPTISCTFASHNKSKHVCALQPAC